MEFCINGEELRKALIEIKAAEENGFEYCLAVFKLTSAGYMLHECQAVYSDLFERAHPTDGNYNWGRYQGVTRNNKFKDGKLIRIKKNK